MKKRYIFRILVILAALCIVLLSSLYKSHTDLSDTFVDNDLLLYKKNSKPVTGKVLKYEGGIKIYEAAYKKGFIEGNEITYHLNGEVLCHSQYKLGRLNGEQKCYYESGALMLQGHYVNNVPIYELKLYKEDGTLL